MFSLTSKFHDNRVNTFGFMKGGGGGLLKPPPPPQVQELQKSPGGIGLSYLNTVNKLFKFLEKRKHSLHKIMHRCCSEESLVEEFRPDVCNIMKISASNVLQMPSVFRIEYLQIQQYCYLDI